MKNYKENLQNIYKQTLEKKDQFLINKKLTEDALQLKIDTMESAMKTFLELFTYELQKQSNNLPEIVITNAIKYSWKAAKRSDSPTYKYKVSLNGFGSEDIHLSMENINEVHCYCLISKSDNIYAIKNNENWEYFLHNNNNERIKLDGISSAVEIILSNILSYFNSTLK